MSVRSIIAHSDLCRLIDNGKVHTLGLSLSLSLTPLSQADTLAKSTNNDHRSDERGHNRLV